MKSIQRRSSLGLRTFPFCEALYLISTIYLGIFVCIIVRLRKKVLTLSETKDPYKDLKVSDETKYMKAVYIQSRAHAGEFQ